MPRKLSTVISGTFRFDTIVRREGERGRRIAIPVPVVRGLLRTGWDRAAPLHVTAGGFSWMATARKMGKATVVGLPVAIGAAGAVGRAITVELWQAAPAPREYIDDEIEQ